MRLSKTVISGLRWCRSHSGWLLYVTASCVALTLLVEHVRDAPPLSDIRSGMQARAELGKLPTEKQVRGVGRQKAAIVSITVLATLLLTSWWWRKPISHSRLRMGYSKELSGTAKSPYGSGKVFWFLLLLIVAGAIGVRWNLIAGSMWWDEAWAKQNIYFGEFEPFTDSEEQQDGPAFSSYEDDWERALWRYWSPLNHPVASLSSQIAHSMIPASQYASLPKHGFVEWVLRLPALIVGVLGIVCVALSLRRWGFPAAALMAAALLAIHPWSIRHTSEIRAYPFLFFAVALSIYSITSILQSRKGSWAGWFGFGLAQCLMVWSHVLAAPLALALSAFLLAATFFAWPDRHDRFLALGRIVVINLLAACTFFLLFGPNIVQALSWADSFAEGDGNALTAGALINLATLLSSGLPWQLGDSIEAEQLVSLKKLFSNRPLTTGAAAVVGIVVVTAGIITIWKKARPGFWLLTAVTLGSTLTLLVIYAVDSYFYPRFLFYLLIPLAIAAGVGAAPTVRWSQRRMPSLVPGLAALALFTAALWPQLQVLNRTSIEPLREVAAAIESHRSARGADSPALQVAGIGHGSARMRLYDPRVLVVRDITRLNRLMEKSARQGGPLLVFVGHRLFNEAAHPDLMAVVQDPARFQELSIHPGIKPDFFYKVYRLRP